MTLQTSKGKTFDIQWASTLFTTTRDFIVQFEDERDISEIVSDFEGCEWFEWDTLSGDHKRAEGYSKIKNIGYPQYIINPLLVQVMLIENN